MDFLQIPQCDRTLLGKVVKSNSHCDYVVQLHDGHDVAQPPEAEDFGFGQFVKLEKDGRHWAVGLIYNSQLFNPMFLNSGPRLSSEPDPMFTPDLISEVRTLLGTVLIGTLTSDQDETYGIHGIPRVVVPVDTPVYAMTQEEIHRFHLNPAGYPQFCYYSHLLRCGGAFAAQLTQQVLSELIESCVFDGTDQRALEILCKELTWKNTMGAIR
jgi:hypothetical protein